MRTIGLVVSLALLVPIFVHATPQSAMQTCDEYIQGVRNAHPQDQQSDAASTAIQNIPANTSPDKAPQLGHKETNDQVIVNADGSIKVLSSCGLKGQIGSISVCTFDKDGKQTCGVKIPKTKEDVVASVANALKSGNGQTVQQSLKDLANASKNQPVPVGALPSLTKKQVADAMVQAGLPKDYLKYVDQYSTPEQQEKLLKAIAEGDTRTVRQMASELHGYVSEFKPDSFVRITAQKQQELRAQVVDNTSEYFCAVDNGCRSPSYTGFGNVETGSLGQNAHSMVTQLSSQPIPVGAGGRVDPVSFYAHAVQAARDAGLDGHVDPRLRNLGLINTGSAEEWGRLYTMMAKQESDFNINSSAPSECSYGILQFCPGEYGLGSMQDVRNPESSLNAVINVTRQGKLFQYFGPLKRGGSEVAKHASWFQRTVAPQVNGEVPYSPVANVAGGNYWSGVSSRGSEAWTSPGYYNDSYSNGSGSSFSPFSSLLSSFGGGSSSVAPPTNNTPAVNVSPTNQPPSSNPPSTMPTAIIHPAIAFSSASEIQKGDSLLVAWAATGVSTTQTCILRQGGEAVAQGNSGTFFVPISAAYPDDSITFALECTLSDSRAYQSEAQKELKVLVR